LRKMEPEILENISTGFSSVYEEYESLSRDNLVDIARRNTIRKHVNDYLRPNLSILEINAGSGIDALYFAKNRHPVLATDIAEDSKKHIENKIRHSGLSNLRFQKCSFTSLENIGNEKFDHIFSNYGGLNCTDDLQNVFSNFENLLHPGGYVSLVIMPKIYPWEMLTLFKGNKNALRRFRKAGVLANVGNAKILTFYHSPKKVKTAMGENFAHVKTRNIGTFYPSAHFASLHRYPALISKLIKLDDFINDSVLMPKGCGDYFIITFQKK
jgi:ubiquinone/menaquinone biosynthesis C-methylase UbiE